MKQISWDNPNKMHFVSGFKTFDEQVDLITTGNVWGNVQYSNYIRPWNKVDNFGYIGKPGQFCKFDMKNFQNIPQRMRDALLDVNRHESYILYQFRVYHKREHRSEVIGYVLCDYHNKLLDYSVCCEYGRCYYKRQSAIRECMEYICA